MPMLRTLPKNQKRSWRIGPPRPALLSQFLRTVGGSEMPSARSASVMLFDWKRDCVPLRKAVRSEEHTSELQSPCNLVCRLLLEKKSTPRTAPELPDSPTSAR